MFGFKLSPISCIIKCLKCVESNTILRFFENFDHSVCIEMQPTESEFSSMDTSHGSYTSEKIVKIKVSNFWFAVESSFSVHYHLGNLFISFWLLILF